MKEKTYNILLIVLSVLLAVSIFFNGWLLSRATFSNGTGFLAGLQSEQQTPQNLICAKTEPNSEERKACCHECERWDACIFEECVKEYNIYCKGLYDDCTATKCWNIMLDCKSKYR